jgi:hypothetical protein
MVLVLEWCWDSGGWKLLTATAVMVLEQRTQ